MTTLTESQAWQALAQHYQSIKHQHMRDWFAKDPARFQRFSLQHDELFLDYSRNRITAETIPLLVDLAQAANLPEKIEAIFSGQKINITEDRAVLHTALRDKQHAPILVNGTDIVPAILETQTRLSLLVDKIHRKEWLGHTGKPIQHIVNVGIGGSYLGPQMGIHALKAFAVSHLQFHFVSTVDKDHLADVLELIDPETTLFIVSSKTFTTIETLTNAETLRSFLQERLGPAAIKKHFIAITAAVARAKAFGILEENIFPMWDWVGGRYSLWSAIGLPLMLMIGNQHFTAFMQGAYEMDEHFRHTQDFF